MRPSNQHHSDKLTRALLEIEALLNSLNLGIEAWIEVRNVDSLTGKSGMLIPVFVGYGQSGNGWQLLVELPAQVMASLQDAPSSRSTAAR